ncbi:MAG: hypothetical protein P4M11_10980 [Candidatus Pacebacteria bacterium]|nr:hypothetical protein [Candidatus Paceibacterota bacterium]
MESIESREKEGSRREHSPYLLIDPPQVTFSYDARGIQPVTLMVTNTLDEVVAIKVPSRRHFLGKNQRRSLLHRQAQYVPAAAEGQGRAADQSSGWDPDSIDSPKAI